MIICACREAASKKDCLENCPKEKAIKPAKVYNVEQWPRDLTKFKEIRK